MSSYPVYREKFSFGNSSIVESGFYITSDCIKCGICFSYCP
ncbi:MULTISPECIES: 4Fe-4S binding protein [Clostridium]